MKYDGYYDFFVAPLTVFSCLHLMAEMMSRNWPLRRWRWKENLSSILSKILSPIGTDQQAKLPSSEEKSEKMR